MCSVIVVRSHPYLWLIVTTSYRAWQSPINRMTEIVGFTAKTESFPEEPPKPEEKPAAPKKPRKKPKKRKAKK